MATATERIASFLKGFANVPLTEAQRRQTYRAFLDTFAVAIGGHIDDAARIARRYLDDLVGTGSASAWASGEALPPEQAAWLNGVAGHVLDYDDLLPPMRGHPSVVLVPALAALAQSAGADGSRYASAYVAGYEVLARLSQRMAMDHVVKGWHSTASLGILGAAAACSVLIGLDERQTANALGLAATQAAGNRQNFGTMAKCFQVGAAAACAVKSALLASMGYDAAPEALDGAEGYMALYASREDLTPALDALGCAPLAIDEIGIDVKKYPCCYAVHRTLDGVLALREEHRIALEDIERVEVVVNTHGMAPLTYHRPQTGLEAKFSMEYGIAAALLDGEVLLSTYDDERVRRTGIQQFLPRIDAREGTGPVLPRWSEISIALKDGRRLDRRVNSSRGDAQNPLTDEELIAKAEDCFAFGGLVDRPVRAFAREVLDMTGRRVGDVIRVLHGEAGRRAPAKTA